MTKLLSRVEGIGFNNMYYLGFGVLPMKVLGYGEDALCYWALTAQTGKILELLGDRSPTAETVLFLRPSFGRQGSSLAIPGGTADSSQFGEFDALMGTPIGVYLIEAKWSRSGEIEGNSILLRLEQVRRHQLLRAYLGAWRTHKPANWTEFLDLQGEFIEAGSIKYPVAPQGSQLSRNLETVLSGISACGTPVFDVLLYLRCAEGRVVETVRNSEFRLVTIDCPSSYGFVKLGC